MSKKKGLGFYPVFLSMTVQHFSIHALTLGGVKMCSNFVQSHISHKGKKNGLQNFVF